MNSCVRYGILIAVLLVLSIQAGDSAQKRKKSKPVRPLQPQVPAVSANYGSYNFTFRTPEGKTSRLSDFAGKVVLVNLWATPCDPCTLEAKGFISLYAKYRKKGFEILSITADASEQDLRSFITGTGAAWIVGSGADILNIFGAYGLPDNYLFLPDGSLAKHFVGYLKEPVLEPVLIEALRSSPSR